MCGPDHNGYPILCGSDTLVTLYCVVLTHLLPYTVWSRPQWLPYTVWSWHTCYPILCGRDCLYWLLTMAEWFMLHADPIIWNLNLSQAWRGTNCLSSMLALCGSCGGHTFSAVKLTKWETVKGNLPLRVKKCMHPAKLNQQPVKPPTRHSKPPTSQTTYQSNHQPVKPTTSQTINQSNHQPAKPKTSQTINQSNHQPVKPSTSQITNQSNHQPVKPPTSWYWEGP